MNVLLDASAVLAALFDEPGADLVIADGQGAILSTVNFTEVLEKVASRGGDFAHVDTFLKELGVALIGFRPDHAWVAAELKPGLAGKDISLADRACLAVGRITGRTILTGDRAWAKLDLGLDIRLIR